MRLVNHEFEKGVCAYLFRSVVVPFRPELYSVPAAPPLGLSASSTKNASSILLPDKGMRIFQGFGPKVRRFGMSFEFDQEKLANPPIKHDQEAIKAFWGIYRWPFQKYNRYSQLEGLELTADETRTMAVALKYLTQTVDLGLSIDGGLGWLPGPDLNHKVKERGEKIKVFGESRFVPEPKSTDPLLVQAYRSLGRYSDSHNAELESMLQAAGVDDDELYEGVQMMLENDDVASQFQNTQNQTPQNGSVATSFQQENQYGNFANMTERAERRRRSRAIIMRPQQTATPSQLFTTTTRNDHDDEFRVEVSDDLDSEAAVPTSIATAGNRNKVDLYPLKPNDLTSAQKEMLLEIEWAQRAFMQSYAIAVIDNPVAFSGVETLTIARLPTRHLPILRREDFWDALPSLKKLSLAILPDWREVVKLPTSWVQDNKIQPSKAVSVVYQILQGQIARRENIKTLHFEWLCGGEASPGLFSRNRHILAAPIVLDARYVSPHSQILSISCPSVTRRT
jgi:hypothetical protein